jgi:hypothetical protein
MRKFRIDVVFVSETMLSSDAQTAQLHAPSHGTQWLGCCRPARATDGASAAGGEGRGADRNKTRHGGVGFLVIEGEKHARLRARVIARTAAGGMALEVRRTGYEPVAIIGGYVPPAGSVHTRLGQVVTEFIRTEYARLVKHYSRVLVVGDLNARLGTQLGRHCTCPPPHPTTRDKALAALYRELGISPLHGRSGSTAARPTSVSPNPQAAGRAEVDYIAAATSLPATEYRVLPTPRHGVGNATGLASTHVPVAVRLGLVRRQCVDARAEGARAPVAAPVRRLPVPFYADARAWAAAQSVYNETGPTLPLSGTTEDLDEAITSMLSAGLAAASNNASMVDGTLPYPSPVAAPPLRPRHRARRIATAGGQLPRALCNLLRTRDLALRQCTRDPTPARRELLAKLNRKARVEYRHLVRRTCTGAAKQLELLRQRNKRAFTRAVRRGTPPEPPLDDADPTATQRATESVEAADLVRELEGLNSVLFSETRPMPAGVTSAWDQYRDRQNSAPCEALAAPVLGDEVYQVLYPPHRDAAPRPCHGRCGPTGCSPAGPECCVRICARCDQQSAHHQAHFTAREPAGGGGPPVPAPDYAPRVHTAKAADAQGIVAEALRFARSVDHRERRSDRLVMCRALATLFSRVLATGRVPAPWKRAVAVPIYKGAKAGPPTSPDAYRTIAIGSFVGKLFGLVILNRLQHWAERNKLLSAAQIGFRPARGAEAHVWTLRELVKHLIRSGQPQVAVLFVDFRKAYDNVHQGALWHVLGHMGVPAALLDVLRDWNTGRTARLRMGSVEGNEYPVTKGVPQGDVLSPLLFNFYIESLLRTLEADTQVGVAVPVARSPNASNADAGRDPVPHLRVSSLAYADDVAVPNHGRTSTLKALHATYQWGKDFGLEMNTGRNKTEALMVKVAGTQPSADSDCSLPLKVGDLPDVHWVQSYVHLGGTLHSDLSCAGQDKKLLNTVTWLYTKYFVTTDMTRLMPPTAQLELLKSQVLGPALYLAALLPPGAATASVLDKVDTVLKQAIRRIFQLPRITPVQLLWTVSRLVPMHAVLARERARFWAYLVDAHGARQDDLAQRLLRLLQSDTGGRTGGVGQFSAAALRPWHVDTDTLLGAQGPLPTCVSRGAWDDARVAARLARAAALGLSWQRSSIHAGAGTSAPGVILASPARRSARLASTAPPAPADSYVPPVAPPMAHVRHMLLGFLHPTAEDTGEHGWSTPLSTRGPGCSGSLLAQSRLPGPLLFGMGRLRLGRLALGSAPFTKGGKPLVDAAECPTGYSDDESDASEAEGARALAPPGNLPTASSRAPARTRGGGGPASARRHHPSRDRPAPSPARGAGGGEGCRPPQKDGSGRTDSPLTVGRRAPPSFAVGAEHACLLCNRPGEDPLHLAVHCTDGRLREHQLKQAVSASRFLNRLLRGPLTRLAEGHGQPGTVRNVSLLDHIRAATAATRVVDWTSVDGRFTLHRLLHVDTWPARGVPVTGSIRWPLSAALGEVFDAINTVPRNLRPAIDLWVGWATRQRQHLASAWAHAIASVRASIDADVADATPAGLDLAALRYPRGAVIHTSIPLLSAQWTYPVNGVCDACNVAESDMPMTSCALCNTSRCRACMGIALPMWGQLTDDGSDWEWLCPMCTAIWLRKAAGSNTLAAGWDLLLAALVMPQAIRADPEGSFPAGAGAPAPAAHNTLFRAGTLRVGLLALRQPLAGGGARAKGNRFDGADVLVLARPTAADDAFANTSHVFRHRGAAPPGPPADTAGPEVVRPLALAVPAWLTDTGSGHTAPSRVPSAPPRVRPPL